ncbi:dopamine receptor 1-like [Strongylocentrotus purpuratus]|uniref:G-protein coupled receptors family 1 profile domain-containing protein n=1 Tax=Strongylocentrotus purpuratus TaxID=7668 RepID=A0A7M7HHE8_STRPU|nr:dopamine receptor 1-like [Strongylocentrotus purpuratus]
MIMDVSSNLDLNSDENSENKHYLVVVIDVVLIFIIIASIAGNLLVCLSVGLDAILRKPSNVFIASLAVADLLVAVLVMPFSLSTNIVHRNIFSPIFCKTWISFDVMLCSTSVIHLCVISLDRYFHIKEPFKYKRWMTNKLALVISIIVWMFKALCAFVPIFLGKFKVERSSDDTLNATILNDDEEENLTGWYLSGFIFCDHAFNKTYATITVIVDFLIPSSILIFVYARIFHLIQTRSKNLRQGRLTQGKSDDENNARSQTDFRVNSQHQSPHKAALMLGTIIGLFLICWTPFFLSLLGCSFQKCVSFSSKTDEILTWLGYLNSCMNPIVYSISNPEFRQSFKNIIHHKPKSWMLSRTRSLSLQYRRNARTVESTC